MVFLSISGYGWAALVLLLVSVALGLQIVRRGHKGKPGCVGTGYASLIIFILLSLTVSLSAMLGSFVYNAFTLPRFKATVVDHYTYISQKRDNGTIRSTTMYQPIVSFRDGNGNYLKLKSDIASSSPKAIGSALTIGYRPGMTDLAEFSLSKYLLMGGGCIMLLIMGYFSVAGIAYALGKNVKSILNPGIKMLMYFVFPLAMLGMLAGMSYAAIEYFRGHKPDMPLWALVICIFFSFVLLLAFYGYIRLLPGKKKRPYKLTD